MAAQHIPSRRELFRMLRERGWDVQHRNTHIRARRASDGATISISASASDRCYFWSVRRQLRQHGEEL